MKHRQEKNQDQRSSAQAKTFAKKIMTETMFMVKFSSQVISSYMCPTNNKSDNWYKLELTRFNVQKSPFNII